MSTFAADLARKTKVSLGMPVEAPLEPPAPKYVKRRYSATSSQLRFRYNISTGDKDERGKGGGTVLVYNTGAWAGDLVHHHEFDPGLSEALLGLYRTEQAALCSGSTTALRVVDLGCGTGEYLAPLRSAGLDAEGLDGNPATALMAQRTAPGMPVATMDLTVPATAAFLASRNYDWCSLLEVYEHVPKEYENRLVDSVVAAATHGCVVSVATPGQGGTGHFNECEHAYVVEKFAQRGFALDQETTDALRAASSLIWFQLNTLVFRRAPVPERPPADRPRLTSLAEAGRRKCGVLDVTDQAGMYEMFYAPEPKLFVFVAGDDAETFPTFVLDALSRKMAGRLRVLRGEKATCGSVLADFKVASTPAAVIHDTAGNVRYRMVDGNCGEGLFAARLAVFAGGFLAGEWPKMAV